MLREGAVHICNGILLNYKKECIWVRSNEVDEPRACYTVWSQSKRERQMSRINTHTWNLERWYFWTYLQGSNGDANTEDKLVDPEGRSGRGELREQRWNPHITIGGQWKCAAWHSSNPTFCDNIEGWDGVGGGREVQEGGDIHIPMADFLLI